MRRHTPSFANISKLSLVALLATTSWGCAQGGGGRADSGVVDTGVGPIDSAIPTDSTIPPADSMVAPDTGTPPDGGMDSGIVLMDSGVMDSGRVLDTAPPMDSAMMDTGTPPECTTDLDCADALTCNGTERCLGGMCSAGSALDCDDGFACTVDSCVEPGGTCSNAPNDGLCTVAGESCVVGVGCMGTACPDSPCRIVTPQCGCAGGQSCYLVGGARACLTTGTTAVGANCASTTCVPGAICVNIASSGASVPICRRVCTSDAGCPDGPGDLCLGGIMSTSDRLCTVNCDPATQTGCTAGSGCSFFTESVDAMRTLTDCVAPLGAGGQGATCADDSGCQAGFACINTGAVMQCLHWCRRPGGTECGFGESCLSLGPPAIIYNGTEYGVCL